MKLYNKDIFVLVRFLFYFSNYQYFDIDQVYYLNSTAYSKSNIVNCIQDKITNLISFPAKKNTFIVCITCSNGYLDKVLCRTNKAIVENAFSYTLCTFEDIFPDSAEIKE